MGSRVPSLIGGERRGGGETFRARSPLDGSIVAEGETLGDLAWLSETRLPPHDLGLTGLAPELRRLRAAFIDALRWETGFIPRDCEELIDGALAYAEGYEVHPSNRLVERTDEIRGVRRMRLIDVPYGTIAAILPQNAFLPLALACLFNGLRAGNRVVLRAPQQSALSASLLSLALERTPELAPWVSVAVLSARRFVDGFLGSRSPGLLHFFGGSKAAADLVARGFDAGKSVLIDGEGNVWAYVDRAFDADRAAETLVAGAFRYNGQTCTSINGALVHPDRYAEVADRVEARVRALRAGFEEGDAVGPVFDEAQAAWCRERIVGCGGEIAVGDEPRGTLLPPTLVLEPRTDSPLVREGAFGPVLWLALGDADAFAAFWRTNRFPLGAAILQEPTDPAAWAARLPGLARLVVNGDPSVEDPFEYWGGYPPSGQNPVSPWLSKYRRTLQIETP